MGHRTKQTPTQLTPDEIRILYAQLPMTSQGCTLAIYSIPYQAILDWSNIIAHNQYLICIGSVKHKRINQDSTEGCSV